MKFIDLNGRTHSKNIDVYKYRRRTMSRSQIQQRVGKKLQELFPSFTILEEMPAWGTRLKIDFYIHGLRLAVEVDGEQHEEYNEFFHGNKEGYVQSVRNDILKETWCNTNGITLIRINKKNFHEIETIIRSVQ